MVLNSAQGQLYLVASNSLIIVYLSRSTVTLYSLLGFTPVQSNGHIYNFVYFNLMFL